MQAYTNSIKCLGVTVETVYMCLSVCNELCFRHKGELCMKTYAVSWANECDLEKSCLEHECMS